MDYSSDNELNINKLEQPEQDDTLNWLDVLVRSDLFSSISHQMIYRVIRELEDVEVKAGEKITVENNRCGENIKHETKTENDGQEQETPPVYYYLIKRGRFSVCKQSKMRTPLKVGELGIGQSFGEEAVLTGTSYHTSITAITDGTLMLLEKSSFTELLAKELVKKINLATFRAMARQNGENSLVVFNVTNESLGDEIFSAANKVRILRVPMGLIHVEASKLTHEQTAVIVSKSEEEGKIACFRFAERGCKSYYLGGQYNAAATASKVSGNSASEEENKPPRLSLVTNQSSKPATIPALNKDTAVAISSPQEMEQQYDVHGSFDVTRDDEKELSEQEAPASQAKITNSVHPKQETEATPSAGGSASTQPVSEQEAPASQAKTTNSVHPKQETEATPSAGGSASTQPVSEQEAPASQAKTTNSVHPKQETEAIPPVDTSTSAPQPPLKSKSTNAADQEKKPSIEDLSRIDEDIRKQHVQVMGKIEAHYVKERQQVKKALVQATHYRLRYAHELQKERDQLIAIREWMNRKAQLIQESFSLIAQKKASVDSQIFEVEKEIALQKKGIVAGMKKTALPETGF